MPKHSSTSPSSISSSSSAFASQPYIGRFAPSPSGPLHIGSLVAALASYLDAKANKGLWYVRMEDLDPPRESATAASLILKTLEELKLFWDGDVLYQSQRHHAYKAALNSLQQLHHTFPCTCSRQHIQAAGGIHYGICETTPNLPFAIRCRPFPKGKSSTNTITFSDTFQGAQRQHLAQELGDFVIKRKDGLYAYQLAVVVDDAYQNITHVVRGIDLMGCTGRQSVLQSLLGYPIPNYGHIPVIVNTQGQKLSKQHFAQAINMDKPQQLLLSALNYLQQRPAPELSQASIEDILNWAIDHWKPKNLLGLQSLEEFEESAE